MTGAFLRSAYYDRPTLATTDGGSLKVTMYSSQIHDIELARVVETDMLLIRMCLHLSHAVHRLLSVDGGIRVGIHVAPYRLLLLCQHVYPTDWAIDTIVLCSLQMGATGVFSTGEFLDVCIQMEYYSTLQTLVIFIMLGIGADDVCVSTMLPVTDLFSNHCAGLPSRCLFSSMVGMKLYKSFSRTNMGLILRMTSIHSSWIFSGCTKRSSARLRLSSAPRSPLGLHFPGESHGTPVIAS